MSCKLDHLFRRTKQSPLLGVGSKDMTDILAVIVADLVDSLGTETWLAGMGTRWTGRCQPSRASSSLPPDDPMSPSWAGQCPSLEYLN
jgi:hypothetical protein